MSDFEPSGFLVVRSSLLPFDAFLSFSEKKERSELRALLGAWLALPEVREAIFLASPSLEESLEHWEKDPDSERGQKVEQSLVKYFARMTTRATPFGLFSGVTLGGLGEKSLLRLEPRAKDRRATRLDGELLSSLAQLLAGELRAKLRFEPSSSLYRAAGRLRFAAWRKTEKGRSYDLLAIEPTPHLEAALARAKGGATLREIGAAVAQAASVPLEEGEEFAARLTERQVLVPLLEPFVTGDEPLEGILAPLREASEERAKALEQVRAELRALDAGGLGAPPARYRELAARIGALGASFELGRLFQVDMVKPGAVALSGAVVSEIEKGVLLVHRLSAVRQEDELDRFREAFLERFEGRAVPLGEALDEESGIGFGGAASSEPLLRGLELPSADDGASSFSRREERLLEKLLERKREVALTEDDLRALEPAGEKPPLPDAFAAVFTLAARSEEALERGDFRYFLGSVLGPSGATLLGRFGHLDPGLARAIREHLRAEERARSDAVFAEVVHLPEGRLGNVIFRPLLREHEIPFLGRSGGAKTIPIEDLTVSLEAGRIVLRSRALGKEVIPRITCAFNLQHRMSQPLHRFLGALQQQGVAGALGFSWGALSGASFLPRVVHGKCVLALARWNVSARAFERVKKAGKEARGEALAALRAELSLPRHVALADMDHILPLDLENPLSQDAFFQLVKDREGFALTELFPEPEDLCLRGPEGRFHHELVLPFARKEPRPSSGETRPLPRGPRLFAPGSEWLFVKLYTGIGTADHVLRALVQPLVREVLAAGEAERWFFVRYQDPRPHLRLRFLGPDVAAKVLPRLHARAAKLLSEGRVQRVQLDTYERELERYGDEEGVSLAEEIFEADSECALAVVAATPGDEGAQARWRLLVRGIDQLLEDLGFTLEEKRAFARREREGYGSELGGGDALWRQLGARFRKERASLEALMDRRKDDSGPLRAALAAFAKRSRTIAPLVARIRGLPVPIGSLASSYAHMHANRLARTAQRAQEACLHYFLDRLYEAEIARRR